LGENGLRVVIAVFKPAKKNTPGFCLGPVWSKKNATKMPREGRKPQK